MELNGTTRLRQSGQAVRTERKKEVLGKTAARQPRGGDRLALSRQVSAIVAEHNRQIEAARRAAQRTRGEGGTSGASGEEALLDAMHKRLKAALKCQKIAARIMAGDRVPPEDRRYLENSDPEGYKLALAMRKPKKDPKEWESVLDEEDKNGAAACSGGSEAPDAAPTADCGE